MSVPIILRRLAQAEFDDAADWYEQRRAGRGAAFTAAVRQVLSAIGVQPDAHPQVHGEVREAPVPGYPYAVYYRPEAGQITVLAVFHTSRDPAEWQRRA
ncbi:MAG TPA: type II toxin-antitoxin system RelE/ParE family toxin [Gemmataceae bacterium]|nr:type II toxin-antitoxin system RelE/ParE family toxin [Gemmataceae bacterium]